MATIAQGLGDGALRRLGNSMSRSRKALILAIVLAGLGPVSLSGCPRFGSRAKAKATAHGRNLFETHCLGCHGGKILTLARRPPSLNGIFQHKYLPSGAPATDAQVRATIEDGRAGIMPPFRDTLSNQDIRDIIAYLHTLRSSQSPASRDSAAGTDSQFPSQLN